MEVSQDPYFLEWTNTRNLTPSTIKVYTGVLGMYSSFLNKSPSILISEARDDQVNHPWMSDRRINHYFLNYKEHLQGLRYNTIRRHFTVIKGFYHHYEITTPKIILANKRSHLITIQDIPSQDDIRLALTNCNKKYQAIIMLMASSGMGRAEVQNLKIKDFRTALKIQGHIGETKEILNRKPADLIGCWKVSRFKTATPYTTFNSHESSQSIITYLES